MEIEQGKKYYCVRIHKPGHNIDALVLYTSLDEAMKKEKRDMVRVYEISIDSVKTYKEQKNYVEVKPLEPKDRNYDEDNTFDDI